MPARRQLRVVRETVVRLAPRDRNLEVVASANLVRGDGVDLRNRNEEVGLEPRGHKIEDNP